MKESGKYTSGMVSVIIPVYNTESYIEYCLDSVLAQNYEQVEIVVIDDGSTDKSAEIIGRVLEGYENAQVLHIENHGLSYARNLGLANAHGEYITFVDSDDLIGPDYIKNMVELAGKNDSELVISGYTLARYAVEGQDAENEEKHTLPALDIISSVIPHDYKQGDNESWAYRIGVSWGHLYSHELWDRYNVQYEESVYAEDVPITLFMNYACRNICILERADYYYIQRNGSIMTGFRGLKKYRLPYASLRKFYKMSKDNCESAASVSRAFYEYGYLRAFAQFAFDLARGADKEKRKELCDFITDFLRDEMPEYSHNPILKKKYFPAKQRIAVRLLVGCCRCGCLYFMTGLLK